MAVSKFNADSGQDSEVGVVGRDGSQADVVNNRLAVDPSIVTNGLGDILLQILSELKEIKIILKEIGD